MYRQKQAKEWLIDQVKQAKPCNENFIRVFIGKKMGKKFPINTKRNICDYVHYMELSESEEKEMMIFWGDWKKVITDLADNLFDQSQEGCIRSLFPEQILHKTLVLSGSKRQKSALSTIIELLAHRLVCTNAYHIFSKHKKKMSNIVLLRRILNLSNMASIWPPSQISKIYDMIPGKLSIVALSGSWCSPIFSAIMRSDVEKMLVYDVIPEYQDIIPNFSTYFPLYLDLNGSENKPDKKYIGQYNLVLWNPPYWYLELYDYTLVDGEYDQNPKQSTWDKQETFSEWLNNFIYKSANTAYKLLQDQGSFMVVVPEKISFAPSFKKDVPEGRLNISDFAEQIRNKILDTKFIFHSETILRKFSWSKTPEILYRFTKDVLCEEM